MRLKVGIGNAAAQKARDAGASKATCSRIRRGKQNFYIPYYHKPIMRPVSGLPETKADIYELVRQATCHAWPKLGEFDRDDLVQEIVIRLRATPTKELQQPDKFVYCFARKIAQEWRNKSHSILKNLRDFGIETVARSAEIESFEYDFDSEEAAQALLDNADFDSALWHGFKQMRQRQHGGRCAKCGSDEGWTIHHVIPRRLKPRPLNTIENTAGLCRQCHDEIEFVNGIVEIGEAPRKPEYHKTFKRWLKAGAERTLIEWEKQHESKNVRRKSAAQFASA